MPRENFPVTRKNSPQQRAIHAASSTWQAVPSHQPCVAVYERRRNPAVQAGKQPPADYPASESVTPGLEGIMRLAEVMTQGVQPLPPTMPAAEAWEFRRAGGAAGAW